MSATLLENTATLEDVLQEVSRINGIVTGTVEYGVRSAMRMAKQGRHAA